MTNKEKCKELKEIRRKTAEKLGIDLHQKECTFEGECKGTCPKCKAEEMQLNAELLKRKALVLGAMTVTGLSLAACGSGHELEGVPTEVDPGNEIEKIVPVDKEEILSGDVPYIPEEDPPIDEEILSGDVPYILEEDPPIDEEILSGVAEYIPEDEEMLTGDVEYIPDDQCDTSKK